MNTVTKPKTGTPIVPATAPAVDPFFAPIGNTKPYFKAAFEGFAGSGKTHTAALVAIGLHQRIGSKKPVVIFDTEKASKFLMPLFTSAGIQVLVRESKSLADLKTTMDKMSGGLSDILIIDSISHVWEEYLQAYAKKVNRTSLQFQDWGIIKPTWKREFSDRFVSDPIHIIMTGRAGYEYDNEINKDTGRRELVKTGVKMKVEGETAYEPDLLVLMERMQEMQGDTVKKTVRQAVVIKDRSTLIDGKVFENPTYDDFAPAIEVMLEAPMLRDAFQTEEGDTALMFRTEDDKREWIKAKEKAKEEIDALLTRIAPASTGKDKVLKLELLELAFGTASWTAIDDMKLDALRDGYRILQMEAVARDLAHWVKIDGKSKFTIGSAPKEEAPAESTPESEVVPEGSEA